MRKHILTICFFPFCILVFFSCKKNNDKKSVKSASGLYTIKSQKYANSQDTLQAIFFDKTNNLTYFFYGSFDASGNPKQIKHSVIKRGDTAINILFDNNLNVKELYCSFNKVPDTTLMVFDHYGDTVNVLFYYANWQRNGIIKLKNISALNTDSSTYSLINSTNYRTTKITDFSAAGFTTAVAGAIAAAGTLGALGVLSCSLGGPLVCAAFVAGTVIDFSSIGSGITKTNTTSVTTTNSVMVENVSDVVDPNTNLTEVAPINPFTYRNEYTNSTPTASSLFNFGVNPCCAYIGQFTNISLNISLDTVNNMIAFAAADGFYTETSSCAITPANEHSFFMTTSSYSGTEVNISFNNADHGYPACVAQYTGTVSGSSIIGSFTVTRNDVYVCAAFTISMNVNLNKIN